MHRRNEPSGYQCAFHRRHAFSISCMLAHRQVRREGSEAQTLSNENNQSSIFTYRPQTITPAGASNGRSALAASESIFIIYFQITRHRNECKHKL